MSGLSCSCCTRAEIKTACPKCSARREGKRDREEKLGVSTVRPQCRPPGGKSASGQCHSWFVKGVPTASVAFAHSFHCLVVVNDECMHASPPPPPPRKKKEKKKGERLKADLTNKTRIIHSTRAESHVIHVQEEGVKKHQVTYLLTCLHRKSQQRTFCLLNGTPLSSSLKILPAQACGDLVLFARGSTGSAVFARMAGTVNTAQYDDRSLAEHSVAMYKPCLLRRTVEKLYD